MNVLVIDDNLAVADAIAESLDRDMNALCTCETSYQGAVEATKQQVFDLTIVDVDLGNCKTGVDFIRYYKSHNPTVKTIVYTGLDPDTHADVFTQLTTLQIDALELKPIKLSDITKTARRILEMSDTRQISIVNDLSERVNDMRVKLERHDAELCGLKESLHEIKANIGLLFKKSDGIKYIMMLIGLVMAVLQIISLLK